MLVMMMCNTSFVLERAVSSPSKSFVPVMDCVGYIFSVLAVQMCRPSECSLTCYDLEYCPCASVCLSSFLVLRISVLSDCVAFDIL
jgi:hypothetical protein